MQASVLRRRERPVQQGDLGTPDLELVLSKTRRSGRKKGERERERERERYIVDRDTGRGGGGGGGGRVREVVLTKTKKAK